MSDVGDTLIDLLFQETIHLNTCFATTGCCGYGLTIMWVGYIACSKHTWYACAGRIALSNDVTRFVGLDPWFKQVAIGLMAYG